MKSTRLQNGQNDALPPSSAFSKSSFETESRVEDKTILKQPSKISAIVVGAGIGGLAVAALLAKQSFKVTVIEKSSSVLGGRASTRKIKGYTLESGIHALRKAESGPAAQVMNIIGKPIKFAVKNSDGILPAVYHEGRRVTAPYSSINLLKYPLLSLTQKVKLIRMLQRAAKLDAKQFDNMTAWDWLSSMKVTEDERLLSHIRMFTSIAFYCEPDLDTISAGEMIRFFQSYPYDAGYPKGGWGQIVDSLKVCIEENGGQIITGKSVEKVVMVAGLSQDDGYSKADHQIGKYNIDNSGDINSIAASGRPVAYGVILANNDKVYKAYHIIMNVPVKALHSILSKSFGPLSHSPSSTGTTLSVNANEQIEKKKFETTAGIVIDIVGIPEKNIIQFLPGKADILLNLDPCIIFRVPTRYDSTLAPPGMHILTAWMPIRSSTAQDKKLLQESLERLTQKIEEVFPGAQSKADFHRRMAFDTVIGWYPGISSSYASRIPIKFANVDNLYFVGDAADSPGIGGSSDAAFTSAMRCAQQIMAQTSQQQERLSNQDRRGVAKTPTS